MELVNKTWLMLINYSLLIVGDDHLHSHTSKRNKTVAIDTSHNEQFTRRLLPAQSPEFDNVINQVPLSVCQSVCLPVHVYMYMNVYVYY